MQIEGFKAIPLNKRFLSLDDYIKEEIDKENLLVDHKSQLVRLILKQYFTIRLCHEAAIKHDQVGRIRSRNTKIVIFKNQ